MISSSQRRLCSYARIDLFRSLIDLEIASKGIAGITAWMILTSFWSTWALLIELEDPDE